MESACVKRLAGFLNRNNRSKRTMKDVPKELENKNKNTTATKKPKLQSGKIYFKNERP